MTAHDRFAAHELIHRWWFNYDEGHLDVADAGNGRVQKLLASGRADASYAAAWQAQEQRPQQPAFLALMRLDGRDLGQVDCQHAVLAFGGNLAGVNRIVDRKGAVEIALVELTQHRIALALAGRQLAVKVQLAALVAEVNVFGLHAGQVSEEQ